MSVYTGESRGELLAWINGLLGTEHKKLEILGTGAIYCQIIDSIYGNLPMNRVKYDAKAEYEYLDNFKILQSAFKRNGVDKPIPVEKLIKCKMQDNLEFCQWLKKYWDIAGPNGAYDAEARSGGMQQHGGPAPGSAPARRAPTTAARTASRSNPVSAAGARTASSAQSSMHAQQIAELSAQVQDMQEAHDSLETERDFYFGKLRDVEIFVGARSQEEGVSAEEKATLAKITELLYASAGLETDDHIEHEDGGGMLADEELPEEETF